MLLDWQPPSPIGIDHNTTFTVSILDKSGAPLKEAIGYDFLVEGYDLSPIGEFYNQTTDHFGIGKPISISFQNASAIQITVWVNPPSSPEASESATFNMTVTPEFSAGVLILAITMATFLTIIVISGRNFNGTLVSSLE